jgi:hypothetical protein
VCKSFGRWMDYIMLNSLDFIVYIVQNERLVGIQRKL